MCAIQAVWAYLEDRNEDPETAHEPDVNPWDDVAQGLALGRCDSVGGREEIGLASRLRLCVSCRRYDDPHCRY